MCQLDRLRSLRGEIYEIARQHKADRVYVSGHAAIVADILFADA